MALLEHLADSPHGATLTELATASNLDKSMVLRIASGLERTGYVRRDDRTGTYSLTFKLLNLANRHIGFFEVHDLSLPSLRELARKTGQLVELAVVMGQSMTFMAKVEASRELSKLRVISEIGSPVNLHTMSAGKVWLANLPENVALRLALNQGLTARTPNSISDLLALGEELKRVRERGYAFNLEEDSRGVNAVGVPIVVRGTVVASLVVAAPASNVQREGLERWVPDLRATAQSLSEIWPRDRIPSPPGVDHGPAGKRLEEATSH